MQGTKNSLMTAEVVPAQVADTGCVALPPIYERTYVQIPDTRFGNEVLIYVGHLYRMARKGKNGWLYVIVPPDTSKVPQTPNHSLDPEEFAELQLKTPYRLDFSGAEGNLEFDYRESKYRLKTVSYTHL